VIDYDFSRGERGRYAGRPRRFELTTQAITYGMFPSTTAALLGVIGQPEALVTDESTLADFAPTPDEYGWGALLARRVSALFDIECDERTTFGVIVLAMVKRSGEPPE